MPYLYFHQYSRMHLEIEVSGAGCQVSVERTLCPVFQSAIGNRKSAISVSRVACPVSSISFLFINIVAEIHKPFDFIHIVADAKC
jgi:hypothetical protein